MRALRTALSPCVTMVWAWSAGGYIKAGSAEARHTELALVQAAVELTGGSAQRAGETDVEYFMRCCDLHVGAVSAVPLLRRVVAAAQCCANTGGTAFDMALEEEVLQQLLQAGARKKA